MPIDTCNMLAILWDGMALECSHPLNPKLHKCFIRRRIQTEFFGNDAANISCFERDIDDNSCNGPTSKYYTLDDDDNYIFEYCCTEANCAVSPITFKMTTELLPHFHTELTPSSFEIFVFVNLLAMFVFTRRSINSAKLFFEHAPLKFRDNFVVKRIPMATVMERLRKEGVDPTRAVMTRSNLCVHDTMAILTERRRQELARHMAMETGGRVDAFTAKMDTERMNRYTRRIYLENKRCGMLAKLNMLRKTEIELFKEHEHERIHLFQFNDKPNETEKDRTEQSKAEKASQKDGSEPQPDGSKKPTESKGAEPAK
uniref:Uncharacterized protein n=1 Tax=Panagrellus redivivus TaxID=6233 RepID=A0A7E4V876_PANRE